MTYSKELVEIVKRQKFKSFWHCLDYLIMAGYSPIDAFGISIKEFGEARIFSDIAFIRYDNIYTPLMFDGVVRLQRDKLNIGIVDDTNIHLSGLYKHYRSFLAKGENQEPQPEIENTCEIIKIPFLGIFILDYLIEQGEKHFGYKIIDVLKVKDDVNTNNGIKPYGQVIMQRPDQRF